MKLCSKNQFVVVEIRSPYALGYPLQHRPRFQDKCRQRNTREICARSKLGYDVGEDWTVALLSALQARPR